MWPGSNLFSAQWLGVLVYGLAKILGLGQGKKENCVTGAAKGKLELPTDLTWEKYFVWVTPGDLF